MGGGGEGGDGGTSGPFVSAHIPVGTRPAAPLPPPLPPAVGNRGDGRWPAWPDGGGGDPAARDFVVAAAVGAAGAAAAAETQPRGAEAGGCGCGAQGLLYAAPSLPVAATTSIAAAAAASAAASADAAAAVAHPPPSLRWEDGVFDRVVRVAKYRRNERGGGCHRRRYRSVG